MPETPPGGPCATYAICGWLWPLPGNFAITQNYSGSHLAVDISAEEGTPIQVPFSGIAHTLYDADGYGNHVVLETDDGFHVILAHLTSFVVPDGTYMNYGSWVGHTGNTGNSSGPHLHFEVLGPVGHINPMAEIYYNFESPSIYPPGGPAPPTGSEGDPGDDDTGPFPPPGGNNPPPPPPGSGNNNPLAGVNLWRVALFSMGAILIIVALGFLIYEEATKAALKPVADALKGVTAGDVAGAVV